jgi:hypothetical protein
LHLPAYGANEVANPRRRHISGKGDETGKPEDSGHNVGAQKRELVGGLREIDGRKEEVRNDDEEGPDAAEDQEPDFTVSPGL